MNNSTPPAEQHLHHVALTGLLAAVTMAAAMIMLHLLPLAQMVKTFGIPASTAGTILTIVGAGGWVAIIIAILATAGSAGLALLTAAGKSSVKEYLRKQLKNKVRRAVIAW